MLHLKSGLTYLGGNRLIVIEELAARPAFQRYEKSRVGPAESYAANSVRVNDQVLLAAGCPELQAAVRGLGYGVLALEMSEFQKMDGGLSCLSLRF
jgi:dimethylargininase